MKIQNTCIESMIIEQVLIKHETMNKSSCHKFVVMSLRCFIVWQELSFKGKSRTFLTIKSISSSNSRYKFFSPSFLCLSLLYTFFLSLYVISSSLLSLFHSVFVSVFLYYYLFQDAKLCLSLSLNVSFIF